MEANMAKLLKYIGHGKVFIFSKSYCPYCDSAKELFRTLEVPYGSVEVDKSNEFPSSFIKFLNQHAQISTYPKIYIGEECIGGYSDADRLFKNMKLFEKLEAQGIQWADA